jgi:GNAT superfamily N-acetyltransferase
LSLTPPRPINQADNTECFDSGVETMDAWLRRRAMANELSGASRTFVVMEGDVIRAYYTLAAACIAPRDTTGRIRRNMPEPIPAVLLGRLAVDRRCQGQGLARALVRDAALRTVVAAQAVAVRCLIVHALSPQAAAFWEHLGFTPALRDPLLLSIGLSDIAGNSGGL